MNTLHEFGGYTLDSSRRLVQRSGEVVPLAPKTFDLLLLLLESHGRALSKAELMRELWPDTFVEESNLSFQISTLRKALGDEGAKWIETLPKHGYRFAGAVVLRKLTAEPERVQEVEEPPPRAESVPARGDPRRRLRAWLWLVAAACGLGLGGLVLRNPRPAGGGKPLHAIPLTSYEGVETTPCFSPDGSQVVFSWDGGARANFDIYVLVTGSSRPLRLTEDPGMDTAPAWSPDGRAIAFIRSTGAEGRDAIYLVSPLGGEERKLAEGNFLRLNQFYPVSMGWSPDAKTLYFSEWKDGSQSIYGLDVTSGERRRVTSPPPLGDYSLAVSADGKTLAFARVSATLASTLHAAPAGGGEPRAVVPIPGSGSVAWMPGGREILYGSTLAAGYGPSLWEIAAAGGTARRLPILGDGGVMPAVSSSGRRLVYVRRSSDVNIWRFDRPERPGEPWKGRKLTESTQFDGAPQISPDGKRMTFASTRTGSTQIWVSGSDGSKPVQLTSIDPMAGSPRWSPDGRSIVFDARPRGNSNTDIFVVDSEGGPPRAVVTEEGDQARPSWSHDGKWIYFVSNHSGSEQIWKARAEGGGLTQLTRQGGSQPFESPDGRFVYYGKSADRAIWRVPTEGGEAAAVVRENVLSSDSWAVTADGLYFVVEERPSPSEQRWVMKLFRFDTGQVTSVTRLDRPRSPTPLTVSRDGKWFLAAQTDREESDLMLVENFR